MRTGHPYLSASSYSPLRILNFGLHANYTLTGVLSRNGNTFAWVHAMTCVQYCQDVLRTGLIGHPILAKWERFDMDFDSGIHNLLDSIPLVLDKISVNCVPSVTAVRGQNLKYPQRIFPDSPMYSTYFDLYSYPSHTSEIQPGKVDFISMPHLFLPFFAHLSPQLHLKSNQKT